VKDMWERKERNIAVKQAT